MSRIVLYVRRVASSMGFLSYVCNRQTDQQHEIALGRRLFASLRVRASDAIGCRRIPRCLDKPGMYEIKLSKCQVVYNARYGFHFPFSVNGISTRHLKSTQLPGPHKTLRGLLHSWSPIRQRPPGRHERGSNNLSMCICSGRLPEVLSSAQSAPKRMGVRTKRGLGYGG
jgi:hypothetical protein